MSDVEIMQTTLLIVDDHPVVREGLSALLAQMKAYPRIVAASNTAEALRVLEGAGDFSAVLLDLAMPGLDGFAAIEAIVASRPELPVIVISASEDLAHVRRALRTGARGYIPKSTPPKAIVEAVQFVLAGNIYAPPSVFFDEPDAAAKPVIASNSKDATLTPRQIEVLQFVCDGRSNQEIADALDLSYKTVKAHVTTIFRTLDVVNRTQAANAARRLGLARRQDEVET